MEQSYDKYSHANSEVLRLIIDSDKKNPKILDVGCWDGSLGFHLKKQLNCEIDGIDIEDTQALTQSKGYRKTYKCDLNNISEIDTIISDLDEKYDFIVFADVLEHLINPEAIYKKFSTLLKAEGRTLVSLPNIGFVAYRILHLFGIWRYTEIGVMDKTHLRFFTLSTMQEFINSCGGIVLQQRVYNNVRPRFAFLKVLGRMFPSLFGIQIVLLSKAN